MPGPESPPIRQRQRLLLALGFLVLAALLGSGVAPYERGTWWMEVAPVLIAVPVLAFTWVVQHSFCNFPDH